MNHPNQSSPQGNKTYSNTGKISRPVKPSLAFASVFLTIATLTCIGSAVMLWDAWNELQAHTAAKATAPEVQIAAEAPSERLSAAAELAAAIRNGSNGTPSSRQPATSATADQRATAWFDSTVR
jgi:hypothetical protein